MFARLANGHGAGTGDRRSGHVTEPDDARCGLRRGQRRDLDSCGARRRNSRVPSRRRREEPPIRVIQGSKTRLIRPQTIAVDPVHDEIIVGDTTARAIFVFDQESQRRRRAEACPVWRQDQAPGCRRRCRRSGAERHRRCQSLGFDRLDCSPSTGLTRRRRPPNSDCGSEDGLGPLSPGSVDPGTGRIFIAQQSMREKLLEPYRRDKPRAQEEFEKARESSTGRTGLGSSACGTSTTTATFRRARSFKGRSRLIAPGGVALNPKRGEGLCRRRRQQCLLRLSRAAVLQSSVAPDYLPVIPTERCGRNHLRLERGWGLCFGRMP